MGIAGFLCELDAKIGGQPKAVVAVSVHLNTPPRPTVNVTPPLALPFDYYGSSEHTWKSELAA